MHKQNITTLVGVTKESALTEVMLEGRMAKSVQGSVQKQSEKLIKSY